MDDIRTRSAPARGMSARGPGRRTWRWVVVLVIVLASVPLFVLAVRSQPRTPPPSALLALAPQDQARAGP